MIQGEGVGCNRIPQHLGRNFSSASWVAAIRKLCTEGSQALTVHMYYFGIL